MDLLEGDDEDFQQQLYAIARAYSDAAYAKVRKGKA